MTSRLSLAAAVLMLIVASPASPDAAPMKAGVPAALQGLIYRAPGSGVIFYVETDGRHVVAISQEGKILWRTDPFIEGGLTPYRQSRPRIVYIGPGLGADDPNPKQIVVTYSSSQSGVMDVATGHFRFMRQD